MFSLVNKMEHWKAKLHHLFCSTILQNINIFSWTFDSVKEITQVMGNKNHPQQSSIPVCQFPSSNEKRRKSTLINTHYLFPFSIILLTILHCICMFASYQLDCLVTHQIFPSEIWSQADIIFSIGASMSLLVYTCLLFGEEYSTVNDMHLHFGNSDRQQLTQGDRVLEKDVTKRILTFRSRAKLATRLMLLQLILYAELYFSYQMLFAHRLPFRLVLFLSLYFPFFTTYCIFSNIGLFAYFFISSQYIKIKQKALLLKMRTAVIRYRTNQLHQTAFESLRRLWRHFGTFNQELLYLSREMGAYNHFWGLYVSIYFLGYILLICYMAYSFLFVRSSFFARSLFMFLGANNVLLLYLVIYQCTNLLQQNRTIQRLSLQMCIYFQKAVTVNTSKKSICTFKLTESSLIKVCFELISFVIKI